MPSLTIAVSRPQQSIIRRTTWSGLTGAVHLVANPPPSKGGGKGVVYFFSDNEAALDR
jgi:hypothetical protein